MQRKQAELKVQEDRIHKEIETKRKAEEVRKRKEIEDEEREKKAEAGRKAEEERKYNQVDRIKQKKEELWEAKQEPKMSRPTSHRRTHF